MPAFHDVSTAAWQKRQSIPSPATWCSWLNGTGWLTVQRRWRAQSTRGANHHHATPATNSPAMVSKVSLTARSA
jgi:hypothetical protein